MSQTGPVTVSPVENPPDWDDLVNSLDGHPLQLWGWGEAKSADGNWDALRLRVDGPDGAPLGGAQVLVRQLPFPLRQFAYVPRGPFAADGVDPGQIAGVVAQATRDATSALAISFEPDVDESVGFTVPGGVPAVTNILLPSTLIIDLDQDEDKLLSSMSKKTRQYVRKAMREGVEVRRLDESDFDRVMEIYRETAERAGFPLHTADYYRRIAQELGESSPVYGAFKDGEMQAFLWLGASDTTAFELYGGVVESGQRSRANYALKWQAMLDQKAKGVSRYDLNGLLNDGISDFKKGFARHQDQLAPAVDVPLKKSLYRIWAKALPAVRAAKRKRTGESED